MKKTIVIIGAGAAGYFSALNIAEKLPKVSVVLLESTTKPLAKVRISGGGRCNVTHKCYVPEELVKSYPRGTKELLGAFYAFQPEDVERWFERRGVPLVVEPDGRMFPKTNTSESIIECFMREAKQQTNLVVSIDEKVKSIEKNLDNKFEVTSTKRCYSADSVVLCTGSSKQGFILAEKLGHTIIDPVPSLFTFKTQHQLITDLAGISFENVNLQLKFPEDEKKRLGATGSLLITHWGLSGPAVLKLSAFGARFLFESGYEAMLRINFLPTQKESEILQHLSDIKSGPNRKKQLSNYGMEGFPKRAWERFVEIAEISRETTWQSLTNKQLQTLVKTVCALDISINGKGTFKEEFVTAGGVFRKEVNFKSMESKKAPNLFFAGEVIDIDGITGGFNFQNAWTGAWIVSESLRERYA